MSLFMTVRIACSVLILCALLPYIQMERTFAEVRVTELPPSRPFMGGELKQPPPQEEKIALADWPSIEFGETERAIRPSRRALFHPPKIPGDSSGQRPAFDHPLAAANGYFDCIHDLKNRNPLPTVYSFYANHSKLHWPYQEFTRSFDKLLYVNLLQLAYAPNRSTEEENPTFFFEIETVQKSDSFSRLESDCSFAYYYGYVTVTEERPKDWKIERVEFYPEDFLRSHPESIGRNSIKKGQVKWITPTEITISDEQIEVKQKDRTGILHRYLFCRLTNGSLQMIGRFRMTTDGRWEVYAFDAG
ncbi:hypothetical protein [Effusibacillus dendaii]|uniref:Uncharacterized protein n=1 Tax=Effusibacillus dendaii TaxID=2743772 RepID=A0A7I8D7B6_9BACL|nr:hypothetical protein [Effusibacillus dendaii]BCJ85887.1 hypothetical protein skT53_08720 [Effusibacillus dendaii]